MLPVRYPSNFLQASIHAAGAVSFQTYRYIRKAEALELACSFSPVFPRVYTNQMLITSKGLSLIVPAKLTMCV